ncbi:transposase [Ferviditalea candida]|uniref:Transposase n=1 Tax=Ferviditalea candida TaxID=3108399 RepID=A0ABU5ZNI9_9BACL|nr:transposase [Paenibacillaceae bacterium T2]
MKKLDKEIAKIMKGVPQTLTSVKGIGPVFAADILAEVGGIDRFANHADLAKYAGLVWNQNQSGEFEAEETSRMDTGNKYLLTISSRQRTPSASMMLSTVRFTRRSTTKFQSISTKEPSSYPRENWYGWYSCY